jgi:hypothetical protein
VSSEYALVQNAEDLLGLPEWELACRVANSTLFLRSELLRNFLLYVSMQQLRGHAGEITEQRIGIEVFNRPSNYSPGEDNIVRNYARQLRKRLLEYFNTEGLGSPIRIEIPRGGYVPFFLPSKVDAIPLEVLPEEQSPISLPPRGSTVDIFYKPDWRMFVAGIAIAVLLLGSVALLRPYSHSELPPRSSRHPLWSEIFTKDRDTFIVPADSGLGILQNLSEKPVTLDDYVSGKYLSTVQANTVDQGNLNDLRTQRYTSMVDLNATLKLSHLPYIVPGHFIVKYARDLRTDDFKNGNIILLGLAHTDPWANLLQTSMNFRFACGTHVDDCYIRNSQPGPGELAVYRADFEPPSYRTYAVVALRHNFSRTGWILLIGGLHMAGTEAAVNTLLDDATIGPIVSHARSRDGSLHPFEILIEAGSLAAEALPAKIVASRIGE